MMERTHLIACGNTLCGDDGLGSELLGRLRRLKLGGRIPSGVRLTDVGCSVSTWTTLVTPGERVIFLDAAVGLGPPGTVALMRLVPDQFDTSGISHGLHPLDQFMMEQKLYPNELPGTAWICLVQSAIGPLGPERSPGNGLSEEATIGVENAVTLLVEFLEGDANEATVD